MDPATYLRRAGRRVVPRCDERPTGLAALVSPSFGYRRDKAWRAERERRQRRTAELEGRRADRLRRWKRDGVFDSMRARGLGDIADREEAELAD
ncbi:MAG: hypothetical protein ABS57_21925 [Mesorhizobium sp. SCN 65-12]|nr:MAG: hypothetical protein ABS57_21925 [Mesorhizobium sp. SCN 65-12]